jgi:hypothetical protein
MQGRSVSINFRRRIAYGWTLSTARSLIKLASNHVAIPGAPSKTPSLIPSPSHMTVENMATNSNPLSLTLVTAQLLSLGAEGVLPGRHIVSLLRVFKQFTHPIPSGQMVSSFKTYSPL